MAGSGSGAAVRQSFKPEVLPTWEENNFAARRCAAGRQVSTARHVSSYGKLIVGEVGSAADASHSRDRLTLRRIWEEASLPGDSSLSPRVVARFLSIPQDVIERALASVKVIRKILSATFGPPLRGGRGWWFEGETISRQARLRATPTRPEQPARCYWGTDFKHLRRSFWPAAGWPGCARE